MSTLPKESLLRTRGEYQAAKKGRKVHTKGFLFLVTKTGKEPRLGITVSSKVGNSVRRHRLKRLIKEVFRLNRSLFPQADVVVIAKTDCVLDSYADVLKEISGARLR
jgi:ribonuclease P protein component